jgi:hypothetical protein
MKEFLTTIQKYYVSKTISELFPLTESRWNYNMSVLTNR